MSHCKNCHKRWLRKKPYTRIVLRLQKWYQKETDPEEKIIAKLLYDHYLEKYPKD